LIELEYARILGKRVIPINQAVIFETDSRELPDSDKQVLKGFYQQHHLTDPNIQTSQDVLNRSHALIGTTDWLSATEQLTDTNCDPFSPSKAWLTGITKRRSCKRTPIFAFSRT
jgi:hypothetical protein